MGPKPAWVIVPRISLTETLTDNGRLSASRGASGSEQITQITPGIRIQGESARLKGYLDYGLSQIYYAQHSSANKTQNFNAFGTLEAVEDWLFLDAGGNISQASISAFGTQSSSNASINANSTETSSFRLSPYTRGVFPTLPNTWCAIPARRRVPMAVPRPTPTAINGAPICTEGSGSVA